MLQLSQSFFILRFSATSIHRIRMSSDPSYIESLLNEINIEDRVLKRQSEHLYLEIQKRVNSLERIITKRHGLKAHEIYLSSVPPESYPCVYGRDDIPIIIGSIVEIVNRHPSISKTRNLKRNSKDRDRLSSVGKVSKIVRIQRLGKWWTRVYITLRSNTTTYRSPNNLQKYNE